MTDIERQMSRFMDEHFGGLSSGFVPPMDIVEDKDSITCTLEIPGMKKEDLEILIEENLLTIRGIRNFVREEGEDKRVHLVEVGTASSSAASG
jgi:HSP20 family protein